jgi:hypothetical protein
METLPFPGAGPAEPILPINRQPRAYRFPGLGVPIQLLVRPSFQPRWATLRNFSETGASLTWSSALEIETPIAIGLRSRMNHQTWIKLARVRHVSPAGQRGHLLGCRFNEPLSVEELAVLIDEDVCAASAAECLVVLTA